MPYRRRRRSHPIRKIVTNYIIPWSAMLALALIGHHPASAEDVAEESSLPSEEYSPPSEQDPFLSQDAVHSGSVIIREASLDCSGQNEKPR